MLFRNALEKFIKRLTYEHFIKLYKYITGLFSSEFFPDELALQYYYSFIKKINFDFNGNSINVVVAPRECYKTLTFSKVFPLMVLINSFSSNNFNDLSVIVLGSYLAKDVKTNIYNDWQVSISNLKNVNVLVKNIRETLFEAKNKEFFKRVLIKTISSKSTLRSTNLSGRRVQMLILDDIDQPRSDKTLSSREYSVIRFTTDWLPAVENGNSLIMVAGNLEHKISIINYLLQQDKVNKLVLPVKVDGKYVRKSWNEEWEENMRKMLGDSEFERLYYHKLQDTNIIGVDTEENARGNCKVFIDIGINDRSMAFVIIHKNTIIEVFKGSLSEFLREGIDLIKFYNPNEIYYEKNGLQDSFMKQIINSYMIEFKDRIRGIVSNTNKEERLALTILKIQKNELQISNSCLEEIQEEIDIYETGGNPHLLDAVSFYVIKFLREEPFISIL